MVLEIILTPPTNIGGSPISLKVEKLTYGIHRNIIIANFANKDLTKNIDVQTSLLDISLNGIVASINDLEILITAARTWWTPGADDSSNVTLLPKIQWRSRPSQYMMIERLGITDYTESDTHEFEYNIEIKIDTRSS